MSDDQLRRQADIENIVRLALIQASTPWELRMGDMEKRVSLLHRAVFGDEVVPGLMKQVRTINDNVQTLTEGMQKLIAGQQTREDDWKQMKAFLDQEEDRQALLRAIKRLSERSWKVVVAVVALVGTGIGIITGLVALGVIKP